MRLIDANALEKVFINRLDEGLFFYSEVMEIINNAPTVTDHSLEIAQKSVELGRTLGQIEGKLARPKGTWIEGTQGYYCSECETIDRFYFEHNFCPNCGARMGGKNDT